MDIKNVTETISMIEEQKKLGVNANVTTVLFDTNFNVIHDRTDLKKVKKLI